MNETPSITARQLSSAIEKARQSVALLRQQAQAGALDQEHLAGRLAALEDILAELAATHQESVHERQLAALYQVSHALGSSLDLQVVLDQVMDAIIQLTEAERGFLMLLNDDGAFDVRVARNLDQETLDSSDFAYSRTITRHVVNTGQPVVTTNAQTDPRFMDQASIVAHALRSIMATPLRARGRIIGVVYVDNRIRTGLFSEEDLALLDALAAQAAIAIDNAQLYNAKDQALTARLEELTMLQWIDRQLNETLDTAHAMRVTLEWSARLCGAESASLGLYEPGADHVRLVAHFGAADEFAGQEHLPLTHPLIRQVFASRAAAMQVAPEGTHPPSTTLCVPIKREGAVIGIVTLAASRAAAFNEDAQALVARLADRAAIAIENSRLYDAVQAANRAKSEFVSLVAHELKAPMTSINGYADLLAAAGPLNEQQQKFVQTIKNNVHRMKVLVSDLTDISRIESGQLRMADERVDVLAAVAEARDGLLQQVHEHGHRLVEDLPPQLPAVRGDYGRVVQVLTNLLSNAIKYTPNGGTITLRANADSAFVRLSVADTGVGLTAEEIARLGTKFWRADNDQVINQPGTGLGLAITRNLVTLMGGEWQVTSTPGQGSTFTVGLPVYQDDASALS